jgi:hypothetical protein
MGLITEEQLRRIKEIAEQRAREIREFTPLVNFELKSFSEIQFIQKVCKGEFDFINAKEGDFMFRCSISNRRYFDRLNSGKEHLIELTGDEPLIEVEVKGLARFAFRCPNAGTNPCRMADFKFSSNFEEKVKEF